MPMNRRPTHTCEFNITILPAIHLVICLWLSLIFPKYAFIPYVIPSHKKILNAELNGVECLYLGELVLILLLYFSFYSPSSDEPMAAFQIISSQDITKDRSAISIVTSTSFWTPFLKLWSRNLELICHNSTAGQLSSNLNDSSLQKYQALNILKNLTSW